MELTIINAIPLIEGKLKNKCNITIIDGIISEIGSQIKGEIIDAQNNIVASGYIDIHTHGGFGKDCMEPTYEAIDTISRYHLSTGITSFCPTTMTATEKEINLACDNIRNYKSNYARIIGIHMEGPYLAAKAAGAHLPSLLKAPTEENQSFVWNNLDILKRVTLAPNLENAAEFTKKAVEKGIQISIGHDDSIDDEIEACVDSGATSVTHMYNCTSKPSRRQTPKKHLGLTEMGLIEDRLVCEVIADDRHVPNKLFKMIYKIKGPKGICLVSDSLSVAGQPEGTYYLGSGESQQEIKIDDGVAVLPRANTYAGSITPISKMVKNIVSIGIPVDEAISMATLIPAKLIDLKDRGDIKVGMLGDLNILDSNLNIINTIFNGKVL